MMSVMCLELRNIPQTADYTELWMCESSNLTGHAGPTAEISSNFPKTE